MFWSIAVMMGCAGNIQALYEQEKVAVLRPTTLPRDDDWQGDVRIRISPESLSDVAQSALDGGLLAWKKKLTLDTPVGTIASVRPRAHVTRLDVTTGGGCADCLAQSAPLARARFLSPLLHLEQHRHGGIVGLQAAESFHGAFTAV